MSISDKSKIYLAIPAYNPDKIVGDPFTGSFTVSGAEGVHSITNTFAKLAFPISQYTTNGTDYFEDNYQLGSVVVTTAVTTTNINYYWVNVAGGSFSVSFRTVLVGIE